MSKNDTCRYCIYCQLVDGLFVCKRHSPSMQFLKKNSNNVPIYSYWPFVESTDWCGDFTPNIEWYSLPEDNL